MGSRPDLAAHIDPPVWQSLLQKRPFRSFLGELAITTGSYVGLLLAYEAPWYALVLIFKRCGQVLQEVMNSTKPKRVFPNMIGDTPQYILEHNFDWARSISFLYTPEQYDLLMEIRIYDLQDYFASASKPGSNPVLESLPFP